MSEQQRSTARVSEAETTASPTAATALQEARRYLLCASAAVERAQGSQQHSNMIPKVTKYGH